MKEAHRVMGLPIFVDVEDVLNQPDWSSSGFPFCGELTLTRIFELKSATMHHKLPYTEVELRSGNVYLRLHLAHLSSQAEVLNTDFQKLIASGNWEQFENSEDFRKNVFAVQEAKIFTGPMSRLSYGAKVSLMHMACNGQNTFAAETYKGRTYFAVTLQSDGEVYNSNKLSSSARAARVINERIIARVKTFKDPTQESGIDGLKFAASVDYRNFVNESQTHQDQLEIYLPLDLLVKFVDADITSQQLIDGSIVLLNGNRIQVPLTGDEMSLILAFHYQMIDFGRGIANQRSTLFLLTSAFLVVSCLYHRKLAYAQTRSGNPASRPFG